MGYRERQQQENQVDPDLESASPLSLVGQLLWYGLRQDLHKLYGLLIFLPRFLVIMFLNQRRLQRMLDRMTAARRLGGDEAEVALQEFTSEFMALLVEKKLVKPDAKPE